MSVSPFSHMSRNPLLHPNDALLATAWIVMLSCTMSELTCLRTIAFCCVLTVWRLISTCNFWLYVATNCGSMSFSSSHMSSLQHRPASTQWERKTNKSRRPRIIAFPSDEILAMWPLVSMIQQALDWILITLGNRCCCSICRCCWCSCRRLSPHCSAYGREWHVIYVCEIKRTKNLVNGCWISNDRSMGKTGHKRKMTCCQDCASCCSVFGCIGRCCDRIGKTLLCLLQTFLCVITLGCCGTNCRPCCPKKK